jgi:hypothetical protein
MNHNIFIKDKKDEYKLIKKSEVGTFFCRSLHDGM